MHTMTFCLPGNASAHKAGHYRTHLHHVGLVCAELRSSLRFYRDLLGLPVLDEGRAEGEDIDTLLAEQGVRLAYAELDVGQGQVLELLQRAGEVPPEAATAATAATSLTETGFLDRPASRVGLPAAGVAHIAFEVADLGALVGRLRAAGVRLRSDPVVLREEGRWHGAQAVYVEDPDGAIVELVQLPPQVGR